MLTAIRIVNTKSSWSILQNYDREPIATNHKTSGKQKVGLPFNSIMVTN